MPALELACLHLNTCRCVHWKILTACECARRGPLSTLSHMLRCAVRNESFAGVAPTTESLLHYMKPLIFSDVNKKILVEMVRSDLVSTLSRMLISIHARQLCWSTWSPANDQVSFALHESSLSQRAARTKRQILVRR